MINYGDYNEENILLYILINKGSHVDPYDRIPERYRRNNYSFYNSIGLIRFK